ncbi:MAG: alpha-amylase family glycosyl hydrolase [Chromatiales bacterium]|nr:alpha-amylase family glycosyl hydrolase [Chromatiales bacterium]
MQHGEEQPERHRLRRLVECCPPCPSSTRTPPPCASSCFDVAEHWIRFGIDGWRLDVAAEIDDDDFWQRVPPPRDARSTPKRTSWPRSGTRSQRWLQGDQFDAIMNYRRWPSRSLPSSRTATLTCKVLAPADQLSRHRTIPLTAHEFANRIDHNLGLYKPDVTYAQTQPARQPRHAALPARCVGGDKRLAQAGTALHVHLPRRAVHLLRRRDRHGRRA